jgi:hypothetical protein
VMQSVLISVLTASKACVCVWLVRSACGPTRMPTTQEKCTCGDTVEFSTKSPQDFGNSPLLDFLLGCTRCSVVYDIRLQHGRCPMGDAPSHQANPHADNGSSFVWDPV